MTQLTHYLNTHTHTHLFNGPFSGTTWVSQYQKGKSNLDFTEARDSEQQWHPLGHMQVCTLLQTNMPAPHHLPAAQPTVSEKEYVNIRWTYQVCADGSLSVERSSRWIWNFWMPFMPSRNAKPCSGTLDVPVTNWRNLARSAWSNDLSARQNHWIYARIDHTSCSTDSNSPERYHNLHGMHLLTVKTEHWILPLKQCVQYLYSKWKG